MKKLLKVILPIMLISMLLFVGCSGDSEAENTEASEEEIVAPDFELNDLDGQTVRLSDLRGSVVLLNFWAYWCSPCASEMPFIQQIYEEWQEAGLVLLSIHVGESAEEAADFVEEYGLTFPVLMDTDGAVATQYGAISIPTTFLIDGDGLVQAAKVGAFQSVEEIEAGLSMLLTKQTE
jgi:peroxiredoxin